MDNAQEKPYIFLDPDGTQTQEFGALVVVAVPTGVIYAHQCAGLATEERELEGFAVPIGGPSAARPLRTFFDQTFHGNPPVPGNTRNTMLGPRWTDAQLEELQALVEQIPFWKTYSPDSGMEDDRAFLKLDLERLEELTEAWIPVQTAYGRGVLIFANSD
ncbi:MAG TPA: DUF6210 family protein [Ktedonobacterales bacterium]